MQNLKMISKKSIRIVDLRTQESRKINSNLKILLNSDSVCKSIRNRLNKMIFYFFLLKDA